MRAKQSSFFKQMKFSTRLDHGGEIGLKKRKTRRPFDHKRALHVVMRSTRARGEWSMLRPQNARKVKQVVNEAARKHGIKLYRFANVGNHLHLLFQARKVENLRAFMREISGSIAFQITGAKKSNPLQGKFWDLLPYSRVVTWGRDFKAVTNYIIGNLFEAAGLWNRKRDSHLKVILASMLEAGLGPPGLRT
jgi:REP element-mobilizing transposase RayT